MPKITSLTTDWSYGQRSPATLVHASQDDTGNASKQGWAELCTWHEQLSFRQGLTQAGTNIGLSETPHELDPELQEEFDAWEAASDEDFLNFEKGLE